MNRTVESCFVCRLQFMPLEYVAISLASDNFKIFHFQNNGSLFSHSFWRSSRQNKILQGALYVFSFFFLCYFHLRIIEPIIMVTLIFKLFLEYFITFSWQIFFAQSCLWGQLSILFTFDVMATLLRWGKCATFCYSACT